MNEIFNGDVISAIVTLLGMVITACLVFLIKRFTAWLQTKISASEYNRALRIAVGIWKQLEDEFKDQPGMGEVKKEKMEEILKKLFPKLTTEELDSINKAVHLAITNGIDGVTDALGVKDLISNT